MAGPPADRGRSPLADQPPFSTWRGIYLMVLGALAVEVVLMVTLSRVLG